MYIIDIIENKYKEDIITKEEFEDLEYMSKYPIS